MPDASIPPRAPAGGAIPGPPPAGPNKANARAEGLRAPPPAQGAGGLNTPRPAPGTYDALPPGLDPAFASLFERALPQLGIRSNDSHARISCQYVVALLEEKRR